jgi:hypothetical protein
MTSFKGAPAIAGIFFQSFFRGKLQLFHLDDKPVRDGAEFRKAPLTSASALKS